jgi:hypothetical protein
MDANTLTIIGLVGVMIYQILMVDRQNKRYMDVIENNTKAINSMRDAMLSMNSSTGLHERLLTQILDNLKRD